MGAPAPPEGDAPRLHYDAAPARGSGGGSGAGEEDLQAVELRFRRLAENLRDAVVEYGADGTVTYLSPGLRVLLRGAPVRTRVGASPAAAVQERIHPEDQQRVLDAIAGGPELTEPRTLEFRLRAGDGTWRWVEARTNPYTLPDGERRVISILRDVTEHREALARARRQEGILRIFVRNAPAAVAMLDRDLRYLLHSERWCADYRLPATDLTGRCHYDVFPEVPERWREVLRRGLGGEVLRREEDRFERADGRVDWVTWEVRPWWDAGGEVGGVLLLTEVVTEQMRRRRERERLEAQSRQAERLHSLEVLAGGVAHDLNNLLTGILGNAQLARAASPPGGEVAEALDALEQATERAAGLSGRLLAVAGRVPFAAERMDLAGVVEGATRALGRELENASASLELRLAPDLPAVRGDPAQLGQAILEVLRNALESMERPGRIEVSAVPASRPEGEVAESPPESLSASSSEPPPEPVWGGGRPPEGEGPFVAVEVRDPGRGMAAPVVERIFEPFFSTKFAGRGLGLAAALGIVHTHGGGIQVRSAPGRGTAVRVVLPAASEVSRPARPPSKPAPARATPGRVLIVDDEALVRTLLRRVLEAAGFHVLDAASGDDALARLAHGERPPEVDAVLLDLTMPGKDGGTVFRELRARHPHLPVVMMSGYAAEDAVRALRGQRPDAFLEKPFRSAEVVEVLRRILGMAPSSPDPKGSPDPSG